MRLARRQQQQVSRDKLIILHADNVPNDDLVPSLLSKFTVPQDLGYPAIHQIVITMSCLSENTYNIGGWWKLPGGLDLKKR